MTLEKPKFKEPCNGCGLCCRLELCDIAEEYFPGASAPCPALEFDGVRMWCGLIMHPSRHLKLNFNIDEDIAPLFFRMIPINQGCGMEDEAE